MSANKCARCEQTVYPVEGLRCLDKLWHKGCFKCHECNMTLNLKNYKGFEKRPYCNAHCPQAKATTVADTPEIRRLAENTRIQSQAKYHEDFEKSKGKGFTAIADDPETLRIKNTSKIISNVAYHGELERKKQMEEKRAVPSGQEEMKQQHHNMGSNRTINNNNVNNNNHMAKQNQSRVVSYNQETVHSPHHHQQQQQQINNNNYQYQQQQLQKQQQLQQQQQLLHKQQLLKQQQQLQYAQESNQINRHSQQFIEVPMSQQQNKQIPINNSNNHHQQQQQLLARQQQQHQLMMQQQQQQQQLMQQQQNRLSMDPNVPINRQQQQRTVANNNNNNNTTQHMMKNQMIPIHQQQQLKYLPMNDSVGINQSPNHIVIGGPPPPHIINQAQLVSMPNGQRIGVPNPAMVAANQQQHVQLMRGFHPQMNGVMPKQQQQQHFVGAVAPPQSRGNIIHPNQVPAMNIINVPQQEIQRQQQQQPPMSRRVFRALYDYVAHDVDEVSFFENDLLIDCVDVDGNWLIGKVARSGQTGMLPANYVAECG